jgi:ABC-type multidrug transport system fused ATPase/permease subunit
MRATILHLCATTHTSRSSPCQTAVLPRTLFGYIWQVSARHQIALCLLAVTVFLLTTVPLELQRRIVNDAIKNGSIRAIVWLALAYAAVAFAEGMIKLGMNVYRSWVSERAVRHLRQSVSALTGDALSKDDTARAQGTEISMIVSEVEPIGGFVGTSVSEPMLQGGILVSVFGYLVYLEPRMAILCILVFSPQMVFVPLIQRAINRRAAERISTLREVSGEVVGARDRDAVAAAIMDGGIDHVFEINMGIFKLKFAMNFLMNMMNNIGVATALGVGGYYAVKGQIEVGTVVAFVSGLAKVNDPWGDLVNWFREMTVTSVRYRLMADAMGWFAGAGGKNP